MDVGSLASAFSDLTGGDGSEGFDLSSLLSRMNSGGLGDITKSWLGDGENAPVSPEQVTNLFGADKLS